MMWRRAEGGGRKAEGTGKYRVAVAIALLALAALGTGRFATRSLRHLVNGGPSAYAEFVASLEPIVEHLPPDVAIGYLSRTDKLTDPLGKDNRHWLSQYAVAPRRLEKLAGHDWLLVNVDDAEAMPSIVSDQQWKLVARGGFGMKLFHRSTGEAQR